MIIDPKSPLEEISQATLFQEISDICAAVNTVVDVEQLFSVSLKKTLELFNAVRGSIFLLDDKEESLILRIAHGMDSSEEEAIVKRMGEGIVGHVAQTRQPVFVSDISNDKRFNYFKKNKKYLTPSFICVPMMVKDKLIGVINIADKESGNSFKENEMQILDFLASQIALNYKRVQLYEKLKSVLTETEQLKNKLGESDKKAEILKKQIGINEKLASIGKLAGGIAHEFNNPLDGVMRYTNLCLENIKDDEIVRGYLLEVKHGLNRMANIVKNLLACSRSDFPNRERVDFTQALNYSLNSVNSDIIKKNIVIEKDICQRIPVIPDYGIERILVNLFRNAIDAMTEGGKLTISARYSNEILIITIKDTGAGIEPKNLDVVFEPFYTTKDMDKGCGLGLTIVGEIVKSYRGKIDVVSEQGKGTTFFINLPIENNVK